MWLLPCRKSTLESLLLLKVILLSNSGLMNYPKFIGILTIPVLTVVVMWLTREEEISAPFMVVFLG